MKNLAIATIVIFLSVFSSCTKDKEEEELTTTELLGKWTLIKMTGTIQNSETTGEAMDWHEFYIFSDNGTFTKIRIRNNTQTTASGTYTTKKIEDVEHLELTYSTESDIIGSCYGNLKEELFFSNNNTLSSTWRNCDGPGLDYQKIVIY